MKLNVILTIVGCLGAVVAQELPASESEARGFPPVHRPRFRFRVSYHRKFFPKNPLDGYPYGVPGGVRKIGAKSTTPTFTEEYETMADARAEEATDAAFREEDVTATAGFKDATEVTPEGRTNSPVVESLFEALPDGWYQTSNGYFKYNPQGSTWDAAEAACEADGGFLAVLMSDGLKQDLLNFLKEPHEAVGADASWMYYMGYYGENGDLKVTPNDSPISATGYSPWCEGSPENVQQLRCGAMDTNCGGLIDISCSMKLASFCTRFF